MKLHDYLSTQAISRLQGVCYVYIDAIRQVQLYEERHDGFTNLVR